MMTVKNSIQICRSKAPSAGASPLHVEAAMAEANVLLNGQQSTDLPQIAAAHRALELLQVRQCSHHAAPNHTLRTECAFQVSYICMHVLANTSNQSYRAFCISVPVRALGSCMFPKALLYAPPRTHVGMHERKPSTVNISVNINFIIVV